MERGNGGKKGKGHQGTCIQDMWTKPKGDRFEDVRWRWVAQGAVVSGGWGMETNVLEPQ